MMNINEITYWASKLRTGAEKAHRQRLFRSQPFNDFPNACCGDASDLLAQYLKENYDKRCQYQYVYGVYRYDDFENTVCIESMKKFGYGIRRVDISKNHILVSCEIGAGDGWNAPHLIFEYDFETEALEYKCLVFPYEATIYRVQYLDN